MWSDQPDAYSRAYAMAWIPPSYGSEVTLVDRYQERLNGGDSHGILLGS